MTIDEMNKAFAEGLDGLKKTMKPNDEAQNALVLMCVVLLQEFLIDHKRIADALEEIANNDTTRTETIGGIIAGGT